MTVHGFAKLRPTSYKCNLFAASAAPAGRAWTTLPLELGYARITNYISCRWTAHESPPYSLHSRLQRRSLGSGLPTPQPPKLRDLSILFLFRSRSTTTIASFSTSFFSKYKKNWVLYTSQSCVLNLVLTFWRTCQFSRIWERTFFFQNSY